VTDRPLRPAKDRRLRPQLLEGIPNLVQGVKDPINGTRVCLGLLTRPPIGETAYIYPYYPRALVTDKGYTAYAALSGGRYATLKPPVV